MSLSDEEKLEYFRAWYLDFIKSSLEASTDPKKPIYEGVVHVIQLWWEEYSADVKMSMGAALQGYRAALKSKDDALGHFDYAKAYRGAPDDDGDGWRPSIEYFERRWKGVAVAEALLAQASREVAQQFEETEECARPYALQLSKDSAESHETIRAMIAQEMKGLREAASVKIQLLEEENRQADEEKEAAKQVSATEGGEAEGNQSAKEPGGISKRAQGGKGKDKQDSKSKDARSKGKSGKGKGKGGKGKVGKSGDASTRNSQKLSALTISDKDLGR